MIVTEWNHIIKLSKMNEFERLLNEIGGKDMLTEERFTRILSILESMGSVTVQQLMTELDASESTIRRDLNTLDANGQLIKVHGGAILKNTSYSTEA